MSGRIATGTPGKFVQTNAKASRFNPANGQFVATNFGAATTAVADATYISIMSRF